jgi:Uncharacterized protein conserved in bacteria (DUF2188)
MLRVWQGVIGAASVGVIAALMFRATTGAARIAPSAPWALGEDDVVGALPAEGSDQGARRTTRKRPGHDGMGGGSSERRPGRARDRTGGRAAKRSKRIAKATVWTVPHDRGWANKREGAKRVAKVYPTKAAAQSAGRQTAMREKVEHVILNRDGEIAARNSYGGDTTRSKG